MTVRARAHRDTSTSQAGASGAAGVGAGGGSGVEAPPILAYAREPANLCTLLGLGLALGAVVLALRGDFTASVVMALWALLCDWYDGLIARATGGSSPAGRAYGAQLDALVDIVAFGVWPGLFLYALGGFSSWLLPGLFILMLAGVIRLSYFGVHGLDNRGPHPRYIGLPMDYLTLLFAVVFAAHRLLPHRLLLFVLYGGIVVGAALMVSSLRTPKLQGPWYAVYTGFVSALTVLFAVRIL